MKILLIRNNKFSGLNIKKALINLGHSIYDVSSVKQISISELNSNGKCEISFFNKPVYLFDKIFFLNTPFDSRENGDEDTIFEFCEYDATLIATLNIYSERSINLGLINTNRSLLNKYYLAFKLLNIGWVFHSSFFNLKTNGFNSLSINNLIVTRSSYSFSPYYDIFLSNKIDIEELVFNTQKLLWLNEIDIINIKFIVEDDSIYFINVSTDFNEVSQELLEINLKEII